MRGFFYFYPAMANPRIEHIKLQTLKNFWGYNSFKDGQEQIINSVIAGKDCLALLPTGGGKSICYQLPALMMEGTCLIVSPLLALMRDQVQQLKTIGAEAEYLSSELDERQEEEIYNRCKEGITKMLYISPERLTNVNFIREIEEIQISLIAVDEAHCISEWGQDFRPGYENIRKFRQHFPKLPCIALTATATDKVLEEIITKLNLKNPEVFKKTFRRENLKINHIEISDKLEFLKNYISYNKVSGLIYTRTRTEAEQIHNYLETHNFTNVDYFHAGLSAKEKHRKQEWWLNSNQNILISTNAFGMGIDKDNVRFVIHYSPSNSIENYYQEIGRAGRDGSSSETILLWNENELKEFDDILQNQIPTKENFVKTVSYLYSIFQIADGDLNENLQNYSLQRLQQFTKQPKATIKNIITFLHNQEIIFNRDYKSPSSLQLKIESDQIDLLPHKDNYLVELLLRNLPGLQTQKVSFNEVTLSQKLFTEPKALKLRLQDLQIANILEYTDGSEASLKFLKPRNDREISGKNWNLFYQIQKNKIQKWEEMKYFIRNQSVCKMKLILTYFGEKNPKNCGKCSNCIEIQQFFAPRSVSSEIKAELKKSPASLEQIAITLNHIQKEKLLENLILLLDSGEVRMLDFRTYALG